jgi:pimeloyl-ACP methyl ester carboxylesterase
MREPTPRVLVIPGLDGTTELWRSVSGVVLPGLRPVWFDHSLDRAHGGLEGLADRALSILDADADGAAPAYVCGESFGGPIALTLARRYPHRVRGLLLVSTFAYHPATFLLRAGMRMARLASDALMRRLLQVSHPLTLHSALGRTPPAHFTRAYLQRPLADVAAYRAKAEIALQFDARPWLHEVDVPSLVVAGVSDRVVPPVAGESLAGGLPRAEFQLVTGHHLAWCTSATDVGTLVVRWLASAHIAETRRAPVDAVLDRHSDIGDRSR